MDVTSTGTLQGDVNGDGIVNSQDLAIVSSEWLRTGTGLIGDVNHDSIVNSQDLAVVSSEWLQTQRRWPGGGRRRSRAWQLRDPWRWRCSA